MTLVVAAISDNIVWMVADTFVTGGYLNLRDYEHQIKVVPSDDGNALVSFAGDQHHGAKAIETARTMPSGQTAVDYLRSVADQYPVEFAYGYLQDKEPRLLRISNNEAVTLQALYLGHTDAFSQFQAIRHRIEIDPVPKAIATFIFGTASKDRPPRALSQSTVAMLRLFFERSERDVGGAAIPYMLGPDGAYLCDYCYGVTDPITDELTRGDAVPHGTSTGGGFSLSVTSYNRHQGIVVYWLQKPGGFIFLRQGSGYNTIELGGSPSEFRDQARDKLKLDVEIFFSDKQNTGKPDSFTILHDQNGKATVTLARYGRELAFNAIDTSTDFRTKPVSVDFSGDEELKCSVATATLAEDGLSVSVQFSNEGTSDYQTSYSARQLDELIGALSAARGRLSDGIPLDHREGRDQEMVVIDPAWRTEHTPHPSLDGLLLRLRHIGVGWVTFLLPHHEAVALGEWLSKNARK